MGQYGVLTYPEISSQTEVLQSAWDQLDVQSGWIETYLKDDSFREVIFIGSGSSYYQAQIMAATFRRLLGRSASAQPSSELMLFRDHAAIPGKKLLVGVSRSGESSEVVLALNAVKELPDWTICSITCYADSRMGKMADCLLSPKGAEKSVVMTKSFSSMTYMMQAAIAIASGNEQAIAEMKAVPQIQEPIVAAADQLAKQIVDENPMFLNYIYLGMGPMTGLTQEACLKIKEMSNVWTEAFGTLEFRHGPKSIIEQGSLVVLLLSEQGRSYEVTVAQEMQQYGAKVLIVTAERGADTDFADYVLETGGRNVSDDARCAVYLPVLQYLGYYTALKKNVNPDEPRNLTQVVKID
ncbi:SIS domain-containing protein [Paenibacillus sp. GCM10027626]|uniref:SIS domain-containing protein n=1 Tax=Paenibacillus sp. GCM10027626 TaxID=3273411 RepID=UPI0036347AEB